MVGFPSGGLGETLAAPMAPCPESIHRARNADALLAARRRGTLPSSGIPGGETFVIAGRYSDRFVRTDDGWRIRERRLDRWWTAGNPAVTAH